MDEPRVQQEHVGAMSVVRRLLPWRDHVAAGFATGHANASLQMMDVLIVMLAGFYNPMVRSQRLIDALSTQPWMQRQTGVARIPRSTLSDALKRFEPAQLEPLIEALVAQTPALGRRDKDLEQVTRRVLAADGSWFALAGEVAWALVHRRGRSERKQSRVRWDVQLDVERGVPIDGVVSGVDDGSEADVLRGRLKPGVIYVLDRGYVNYRLLEAIGQADSNVVLRLRKDNRFTPHASRELTARDAEAGVISDQTGLMPGAADASNADCRSYTAPPPDRTLRRVRVRDDHGDVITLMTDLLDVPAYTVAAIYQRRWHIELFFRWIKCYAAYDHALCQHHRGLTLQFYVAIIGTLLLHIATGRRPSKYALFWLDAVLRGDATWEHMRAGLARTERERELERQRRARKRLASKTAG